MSQVSELSRINPVAASNDPVALRRALETIVSVLDNAGIGTATNTDTAKATTSKPPARPGLTVEGVDGKFLITITPPQMVSPLTQKQRIIYSSQDTNQSGSNISYELRCADDIDATTNVIKYGPDTRVQWEIQNPDQHKFWWVRAKYSDSDFGVWQIYIDPTICGPARVWSGQMASTSIVPNMQLNTTNYATCDSIDDGAGHATIRVYGAGGIGTGWTRLVGTTTEGPFSAASLTGYNYATKYYVIYDEPHNIYRVFTIADYPKILPDYYRWVGSLTTVSAGGGGGGTGGGGGGGGTGGCVEVGTPTVCPVGTTSEREICDEWIWLHVPGCKHLSMNPETLVKVWVKAKDLHRRVWWKPWTWFRATDRVAVGRGGWRTDWWTELRRYRSMKVKRTCPGGEYRAGEAEINLHNLKAHID